MYIINRLCYFAGSALTGDLLHEISNEGAREQFMHEFLEQHILPVMIQCAKVIILVLIVLVQYRPCTH